MIKKTEEKLQDDLKLTLEEIQIRRRGPIIEICKEKVGCALAREDGHSVLKAIAAVRQAGREIGIQDIVDENTPVSDLFGEVNCERLNDYKYFQVRDLVQTSEKGFSDIYDDDLASAISKTLYVHGFDLPT